jgi:hypothetical protein
MGGGESDARRGNGGQVDTSGGSVGVEGESVEDSFHHDQVARGSVAGVGRPIQLTALVVDGGGGGVEVLGPACAEHVPTDQADDLIVAISNGQDQPVGEEVLDSPVWVAAAQARVDELIVAEPRFRRWSTRPVLERGV